MSDKISTTALSEIRDEESKQLFQILQSAGYISRSDNRWQLTYRGENFGGEMVDHPKFGKFIVWPKNLVIDDTYCNTPRLSATQLGEHFQLSAKKINLLLSELGWIRKHDQGWVVTSHGIKAGGEQREDKEHQRQFVSWHMSLAHNKRLKRSVIEFLGQDAEIKTTDKSFSHFQFQFESKHRTLDGHFVRSKAELIIDNWLYMANVVHAYARPLPIEDNVLSDFYLPKGKVYIQYWGDDKGAFDHDKIARIRLVYEESDFELIEIFEEDISQLDKILPLKLRPYGIKAY